MQGLGQKRREKNAKLVKTDMRWKEIRKDKRRVMLNRLENAQKMQIHETLSANGSNLCLIQSPSFLGCWIIEVRYGLAHNQVVHHCFPLKQPFRLYMLISRYRMASSNSFLSWQTWSNKSAETPGYGGNRSARSGGSRIWRCAWPDAAGETILFPDCFSMFLLMNEHFVIHYTKDWKLAHLPWMELMNSYIVCVSCRRLQRNEIWNASALSFWR